MTSEGPTSSPTPPRPASPASPADDSARSPRSHGTLAVLIGGGVFLISGAALVTYVLTGAPMALVLAVLAVAGAAALSVTVLSAADSRREWVRRVQVGIPTGLLATAVYDGSRWLLVQAAGMEASPFAALPLFGQALLTGIDDPTARITAGVAFHLLNGVAFGVAYTVWFGSRPFWVGILFALGLEAFMLAIYPGWLDPRSIAELTQVSLVGHLAYGIALGLLAPRLLRRTRRRQP